MADALLDAGGVGSGFGVGTVAGFGGAGFGVAGFGAADAAGCGSHGRSLPAGFFEVPLPSAADFGAAGVFLLWSAVAVGSAGFGDSGFLDAAAGRGVTESGAFCDAPGFVAPPSP